jgi:RecA/RadA recombinase
MMEHLKTGCAGVDSLTDGGLATGTITQVFGEKALGKSILSFQAACALAAEGGSAVILDTEQSYSSYLVPYWKERMLKRFGGSFDVPELRMERAPRASQKKKQVGRGQLITALDAALGGLGVAYTDAHLGAVADLLSPEMAVELPGKGACVMVVQVPEVVDLLALHGVDAAKEVSSGGRVELRLKQTPSYHSALHRVVRETGAKLLVYDSVSAPFKSSFPSTQDLPARSAGMAMLLAHAQRLCVEFGIAVLVTSHVSIDPINPWDRVPYGGVILGHDAKFSLELTKSTASRNKDRGPEAINPEEKDGSTKAFWAARHPALEEYTRFAYAKQDGEGFH